MHRYDLDINYPLSDSGFKPFLDDARPRMVDAMPETEKASERLLKSTSASDRMSRMISNFRACHDYPIFVLEFCFERKSRASRF